MTGPGARSICVGCGADETGAMSTMIAGKETPGSGRCVYQFKAKRDQRGMRGDDRERRRAPAPDAGLVGDIMQRERVHGAQLRPSRPTSAILR